MITKEQFERWQDFSTRMARTLYRRKKDIIVNVEHFFALATDDDLLSIVDWDHCDPYPPSSRYYHKTKRTECWHCSKLAWHKKMPGCTYDCEDGIIFDYAQASYVCNRMSELFDDLNPHYEDERPKAYEKYRERHIGPIHCCVRAGIDIAVSPSMGVLGFTAGDIRKMYPDGVPDWVTGGNDHCWTTQHFDGVIPGVGLVPGKSELNGTFAEMPNSAQVWL